MFPSESSSLSFIESEGVRGANSPPDPENICSLFLYFSIYLPPLAGGGYRGGLFVSCYHPLAAVKTGNITEAGKDEFKVVGEYVPELENNFGDDLVRIPCGKCLGCRLDYSRQWANRMIFELDHYNGKAVFVTLTYNDDHVPKVFDYDPETGECLDTVKAYTLCKEDFQKFFKRLRKKFSDREIKFYLGAEYGPNTMRPHAHAIIFGIGFDDFDADDCKAVGRNELGDVYYNVRQIQEAWSIYKYREEVQIGKRGKPLKKLKKIYYYDPIGFVCVSEVSWKTCAYVSRYVMKKAFSGYSMLYESMGILPEFSLMSRNPGIGSKFLEDHPDMIEYENFYFNDGRESIKLPLTKNLLKYIEKLDPDRYNDIKECNKKFAHDNELLELLGTGLDFKSYMDLKERLHLDKLNSLRRQKV